MDEKTLKTFRIQTLGCKVNRFDSDSIVTVLSQLGWQETNDQAAQATIINSCSVTANATKEALYRARRSKRENPQSKVIVTGCYAQTHGQRILDQEHVDLVIPNEAKSEFGSIFERWWTHQNFRFPETLTPTTDNKQSQFKSSPIFFTKPKVDRSRAFVKIQDGCNSFCTYCLIPYARGKSKSVPPQQVLDACKELYFEEGIREFVLTGIHIGEYGKENLSEAELSQVSPIVALLEAIFRVMPDIRIRISSLEPSEVTPQLLQCIRNFKSAICPHFHLPLQSGSNAILKKMRRSYSKEGYLENIACLREAFGEQDVFIGADVMVGFPGEGETEFAETMETIEKGLINDLHVFPYSKREQTAALRLPNHVDPAVKKDRTKILQEWAQEKRHAYQQSQIGKQKDVILEQDHGSFMVGLSEDYLKIRLPGQPGAVRQKISCVIKGRYNQQQMLALPL